MRSRTFSKTPPDPGWRALNAVLSQALRHAWRVRFMAAGQALRPNVDLFLLRKTVCRMRVFEIGINAPTLASIGAVGAIGIAAEQPMFEDMRRRGANSARIPP